MGQFYSNEKYKHLWADDKSPKLVHVTYMEKKASQHPRVLSSSDNFSEIVLVKDGGGEIYIGDQILQVGPDDLMFYNAGIPHDQRTAPGKPFVRYAVAVTGFKRPGCRPNCLLPDDIVPVIAAGKLAEPLGQTFELLYNLMAQDCLGNEKTTHYVLQALLAQVDVIVSAKQNPIVTSEREEIPLATRVRAYMDEHFCDEISLQDLADRFNISSFYLAHIFKKQYGYPPLQYILRRRIGLAQTLLITTDLPVGEIGARVGYANPSHFNLIFTKNTGTSPRKYRLNYLN
ncbi:AraC family transcriptional regulator [Mageeibacillus indolicus]|jgi:hypothetical protein|uniref:Transcriptional regulator, AraC family n=2 Tax=Mageeibacillus indolicus TaxID=884684 RepID=D3QZ20_MAGIU|nr:AraC family transcriptional regulator [Mageeibacillus indolicus]ADC91244.1 transcriptional regulator, AraC family [Mageeibacillus indolicus UPII9-5]PNH17995.1 AraC family transcriptional regulator [Mageeibacillus indolicus]